MNHSIFFRLDYRNRIEAQYRSSSIEVYHKFFLFWTHSFFIIKLQPTTDLYALSTTYVFYFMLKRFVV